MSRRHLCTRARLEVLLFAVGLCRLAPACSMRLTFNSEFYKGIVQPMQLAAIFVQTDSSSVSKKAFTSAYVHRLRVLPQREGCQCRHL
eukprot:4169920-Amphidinium_carterae.1